MISTFFALQRKKNMLWATSGQRHPLDERGFTVHCSNSRKLENVSQVRPASFLNAYRLYTSRVKVENCLEKKHPWSEYHIRSMTIVLTRRLRPIDDRCHQTVFEEERC